MSSSFKWIYIISFRYSSIIVTLFLCGSHFQRSWVYESKETGDFQTEVQDFCLSLRVGPTFLLFTTTIIIPLYVFIKVPVERLVFLEVETMVTRGVLAHFNRNRWIPTSFEEFDYFHSKRSYKYFNVRKRV